MRNHSRYLSVLSFYFGHNRFRDRQVDIISAIDKGEDVLVIQPTGAGKSVCFQIPALRLTSGYALVVVPLRSLIIDQLKGLRSNNVPAFAFYGGIEKEDKRAAFAAIRKHNCKLLYITPEQLQWEALAKFLVEHPPAFVVFDEAHCVSQWGQDFRPSYKKAAEMVKGWRRSSPIPLALFTATATPSVAQDITRLVGAVRPRLFLGKFVRSNLHYLAIESSYPRRVLLKYVSSFMDQSVIVFCSTIKTLETASKWLKSESINHKIYHGRLDKDLRKQNQALWTQGVEKVILCTSAFGMGVDKPDVRLVFHLGLPLSIEAYQQEVGRGGRDGKVSQCVICYGQKDVSTAKYMLSKSKPDQIAHKNAQFQCMLDYLEKSKCRAVYLSNYFNADERVEACGHCDYCRSQTISLLSYAEYVVLALIHALAGSQRAGGYGARMLSEILGGRETGRVLARKFQFHPMWGMFKGKDERVENVIETLLEKRLIQRTTAKYKIVLMTIRGSEAYRQYIKERRARPLDPMDIEERVYEFDNLRIAIAERLSLPLTGPWPDTLNRLIAEAMPGDLTALSKLDNISQSVCLLYGGEIIETVDRLNNQRVTDHSANDQL